MCLNKYQSSKMTWEPLPQEATFSRGRGHRATDMVGAHIHTASITEAPENQPRNEEDR